jgi:hypothetical protein
MSDELVWLLITTAVALAAGGISGWVSAAYQRREQKKERIREEVLRWANPVLDTVRSLESRLRNILKDDLYLALNPRVAKKPRPVREDWAIDYKYTLESTTFLFAEFFAWFWRLRQELSLELFESQEAKKGFDDALWAVARSLSDWPADLGDNGTDAQVFVLQQRAIGEFLIQRDGEELRVAGYPEFLRLQESSSQFVHVLVPLKILLEGLQPDTKRYRRLQNTHEALGALRVQAEALLSIARTR